MKKRYFIWTYGKDVNLMDHMRNMQSDDLVVERTKIVNGIIIETDDTDRISDVRKYCNQHQLMIQIDRDAYLQPD